MSKPMISVIIPSYNHAGYIDKAIESALNQTFTNIEVIIGDDCSMDDSKEIINRYDDKRIRKYFFDKNVGGAENLNRLIKLAKTEYIAILNSDDYWEPTKLEKQYKFLEENPEFGACFTWAQYIDRYGDLSFPDDNIFIQKNRSQEEWFSFFVNNGNCLCHPSVLIRKKIYDEIGYYLPQFRQLPDFFQWIKLVKKYKIHIIEEALVNFRWFEGKNNTSSISIGNMNRSYHECHRICSEIFNDVSIDFFCKAFITSNNKYLKNSIFFEYEKNIILYNSNMFGNIGKLIAYENIGKLLEDEQNRYLLENEYEFTMNYYYTMGEQLTFNDINSVEIIEKVPDKIANSRGYKLLNKIYNSKIYNILRKR